MDGTDQHDRGNIAAYDKLNISPGSITPQLAEYGIDHFAWQLSRVAFVLL
jgi:hypothetical protein